MSSKGQAESFLGIKIVNGTARFNTSERQLIKEILSNLPRPHLQNIQTIRAERSSEPWLGRHSSNTGLIELNKGWNKKTLLHEIGHAVYDSLPKNLQEEWATLHHRSRKSPD